MAPRNAADPRGTVDGASGTNAMKRSRLFAGAAERSYARPLAESAGTNMSTFFNVRVTIADARLVTLPNGRTGENRRPFRSDGPFLPRLNRKKRRFEP